MTTPETSAKLKATPKEKEIPVDDFDLFFGLLHGRNGKPVRHTEFDSGVRASIHFVDGFWAKLVFSGRKWLYSSSRRQVHEPVARKKEVMKLLKTDFP